MVKSSKSHLNIFRPRLSLKFGVMSLSPITTVKTVSADGIEIFYREAGSPTAPVFLLLHGFPSSSFQYRDLITKLATKYRVIVSPLVYLGSNLYSPSTTGS